MTNRENVHKGMSDNLKIKNYFDYFCKHIFYNYCANIKNRKDYFIR